MSEKEMLNQGLDAYNAKVEIAIAKNRGYIRR